MSNSFLVCTSSFNQLVRINVDQIKLYEAFGDSTRIYLFNDDPVVVHHTAENIDVAISELMFMMKSVD